MNSARNCNSTFPFDHQQPVRLISFYSAQITGN